MYNNPGKGKSWIFRNVSAEYTLEHGSEGMRKYLKKKWPLLVLVTMLLGLCVACSAPLSEKIAEDDLTITVEEYINTKAANGEDTVISVDILAVGDNLIHSGLYKSGMSDDGEWNYDHLYKYVRNDIADADIAIVNQETIFVENHDSISSYPTFGSPTEIGDALANAGFDVVLHASNHTMDKGTTGVTDTLNFWKTKHPVMTVLGINENQEAQDTITVVEKKGIRFAMLNYTYGLNGYTLPADEAYMVNVLDKEKVAAAIAQAKEISDVIVFFCHVGTEYVYEPSEASKEWVNFLLEQGVDIAIDSHPHVLEPYTMLTGEDGHQMLVYYSMGNFISTQDAIPRLIGGMAKITVEKRINAEGSEIVISDYTLEPLVTHWNHTSMTYAVYKLSDYTDDLASQHGINSLTTETFNVESLNNLFNEIMNTTVNPATGVLE